MLAMRIRLLVSALMVSACSAAEHRVEPPGTYQLESTFKTPMRWLEGAAPDLYAFAEVGEHPDAVGTWILTLLAGELGEPYRSLVAYAAEGADAPETIQEFLEERAPEKIARLVQLSNDVRTLTSVLHLSSDLLLAPNDEKDVWTGTSVSRFTGVFFPLEGITPTPEQPMDPDLAFSLDEIGASSSATRSSYRTTDDPEDDRVLLILDTHSHVLAYGRILDYGLNKVVARRVDPFAASFLDAVVSSMPCDAIGEWLSEHYDFTGSKIAFASACAAGVDQGMQRALDADLVSLDATLVVAGDAWMSDENNDESADVISEGEWDGAMTLTTGAIALRRPSQSFFGRRSRGADGRIE